MASTTSVTIRLDKLAINRLLIQVGDDGCRKAADKTVRRAQAFAPHRTGKLAASIKAVRTQSDERLTEYTVGSDLPYALYQEKGTRGATARHGGVLAFQPRGSFVVIFRPRTGPVPATHFLAKAYALLSVSDFV